MQRSKDQSFCPKCGRMYCEGYWNEGVCIADMSFCGEPTADGDEIARCLRIWYEAHRESRWERSRFNSRGFRPGFAAADEFMLGLINEVGRIEAECKRRAASRK